MALPAGQLEVTGWVLLRAWWFHGSAVIFPLSRLFLFCSMVSSVFFLPPPLLWSSRSWVLSRELPCGQLSRAFCLCKLLPLWGEEQDTVTGIPTQEQRASSKEDNSCWSYQQERSPRWDPIHSEFLTLDHWRIVTFQLPPGFPPFFLCMHSFS